MVLLNFPFAPWCSRSMCISLTSFLHVPFYFRLGTNYFGIFHFENSFYVLLEVDLYCSGSYESSPFPCIFVVLPLLGRILLPETRKCTVASVCSCSFNNEAVGITERVRFYPRTLGKLTAMVIGSLGRGVATFLRQADVYRYTTFL